jgi:hypothetical protein
MKNIEEGLIVIIGTGQCGTVSEIIGNDIWVLLRNGDIWVGPLNRVRMPQSQEDQDACPVNVERLETKRTERED